MNSLTKEEKLNLTLQLIEKHGITAYEIGDKTDLNTSGVARIIKGEVKNPQNSTLNTMLDYVQKKILASQIGEINQVKEPVLPIYAKPKISHDKVVPYYDIEIAGSIISSFDDMKEYISFYVDYEPLNDCTAFLPYAGDSMLPKYKSGDTLGVKQIKNFDILLWGEAHLVITGPNANNYKTVKNIYQHQNPNKIILRAINEEYTGDTIIDKEDIVSLFIVKGKVELNQI